MSISAIDLTDVIYSRFPLVHGLLYGEFDAIESQKLKHADNFTLNVSQN